MKIEVDYNELVQFGKRIMNLSKFREVEIDILEHAANEFIESVQKRTPKTGEPNPKTGRVWNWTRIPGHPPGQLREAWEKDNPDLRAKVERTHDGYKIDIVNNTEYASWVEEGHTKWIYGRNTGEWVFGTFFLKDTEVEFENGKLDSIAKKRLERWIREVLKQ